MDFITGYGSDHEDDTSTMQDEKHDMNTAAPPMGKINAAPTVQVEKEKYQLNPYAAQLNYNMGVDQTDAPLFGPTDPNGMTKSLNANATVMGSTQAIAMNDFVFKHEYYQTEEQLKRKRKKKSKDQFGEDQLTVLKKFKSRDEAAEALSGFPAAAIIDVNQKYDPVAREATRMKHEETIIHQRRLQRAEALKAHAKFHIRYRVNYQGRSFMRPESWLKPIQIPGKVKCYLPKRQLATFEGHTQGITALEFFPKYGHLFMSGSKDHTIKLWDALDHQKCIATYFAHQKAITDLSFSCTGAQFLSTSLDGRVLLWDTEKGKMLREFHYLKDKDLLPTKVAFHPSEEKQHLFLLGTSRRTIAQFDARSGHAVEFYNRHKGAITDIRFLGKHGSFFVSAADDKYMRVWSFGSKGTGRKRDIKQILDPDSDAIFRSIVERPQHDFFLATNMAGIVQAYESKPPKFNWHKKKRFQGHKVDGKPISIDMSHDGEYIVSGDADGHLCFYQYGNPKFFKKMKAHPQDCTLVKFHPCEKSKVITASIHDPIIKMWD